MVDIGTKVPTETLTKVEEVNKGKKDFALFKTVRGEVSHTRSFPQSEEDIAALKEDKDRDSNWKTRVYPKYFEALKEEKEPCFIVMDVRYADKEDRKTSKLVFIGWCPEKATVKDRMVFAGTMKNFAEKANIAKRLTGHVPADLEYDVLIEALLR